MSTCQVLAQGSQGNFHYEKFLGRPGIASVWSRWIPTHLPGLLRTQSLQVFWYSSGFGCLLDAWFAVGRSELIAHACIHKCNNRNTTACLNSSTYQNVCFYTFVTQFDFLVFQRVVQYNKNNNYAKYYKCVRCLRMVVNVTKIRKESYKCSISFFVLSLTFIWALLR